MSQRCIAFVVALAALAAGAAAQTSASRGLSLRGGVFLPNSTAARSEAQNWAAIGIVYRLRDLKYPDLQNRFTVSQSVSLDWTGSGSFSVTPVLFNYIQRRDSIYGFAGAGVAFVRVPNSNQAEFGYNLGVGYDLVRGGDAYFGEVRYLGTSDGTVNGLSLQVGIRF
jgi:hypothetical protein